METHSIPQLVLVVDDQAEISSAAETMLIEIGVQDVVRAESASEALLRLDLEKFDLAILDYNLGMGTGWSVAQRLCRDDIRMIVTTDQDGVRLPPACGGAPVLKRPYSLNMLATLVASGPDA